jgi:hypothetical protein
MINPGDNFMELVTWKRAMFADGYRYWSNSYTFTTPSIFTRGTAEQLCHSIATGEQFLHGSDTHIFGLMAWKWSAMGGIADRAEVYIWPEFRIGNRPQALGDTMLEWEYAALYNKATEAGRSGHMAFRHVLKMADVVPYRDTGFALKSSAAFGDFHTALVEYWLNDTPYQMAIWTRTNEHSYPSDTKPVSRLVLNSAIKLQSISDAQERKTFKARSYPISWRVMLPELFQSIKAIYVLIEKQPEGMAKGDIEILSTMAGTLKGAFKNLESYWKEGIKPEVMINWRPFSGLDPMSGYCEMIVKTHSEGMDDLGAVLVEMQEYPDPFIPLDFVMPFILLYSWYILQYERVGAMRWTGTPLPPLSVILPD